MQLSILVVARQFLGLLPVEIFLEVTKFALPTSSPSLSVHDGLSREFFCTSWSCSLYLLELAFDFIFHCAHEGMQGCWSLHYEELIERSYEKLIAKTHWEELIVRSYEKLMAKVHWEELIVRSYWEKLIVRSYEKLIVRSYDVLEDWYCP